jgi:hypothetical protein
MVASVFLFLGLFSIFAGIRIYLKSSRVRHWPTTLGNLLEKKVILSLQAAAKGPADRFEVAVKYCYSVGGEHLIGDRLYPSHRILMADAAEKFKNQLPSEVIVHYNPKDPKESYLFSDSIIFSIIAILFGIIFALGSLVAILR